MTAEQVPDAKIDAKTMTEPTKQEQAAGPASTMPAASESREAMAASPKGKMTYLAALKSALDEEMARNPDMICQGEDIGRLGGAFGVTEGLQEKYG
ncbi:hypothetical protein EON77_17355, partial [bacterium]